MNKPSDRGVEKWFISICPSCGTEYSVNIGVAKGDVVSVKAITTLPTGPLTRTQGSRNIRRARSR